jgi:hypothetical protein
MFFSNSSKTPDKWYILKDMPSNYRASAIAYMKRNNINFVDNVNGKIYSLTELENSLYK